MNHKKTPQPRILKDPKWLQPLSDPPENKLLYREHELTNILQYLSDLFISGQAQNIFITGKPGTGKTALVKQALNEINNKAAKTKEAVKAIYVNAGLTRNPYYTLTEILKQLNQPIPNTGWQMSKLKQTYEKQTTTKTILIAIDEVDSIILKEKEPLIYYLNRTPKTTLILISNTINDVIKLPQRTISTLSPRLIHLQPYSTTQIKKILTTRANQALTPGTLQKNTLTKIAKMTQKTSDIRASFHLLLTAATQTQQTHKKTITNQDIQKASKDQQTINLLREYNQLKEKQKHNTKNH
jgi:archaeal cell division control protein 6